MEIKSLNTSGFDNIYESFSLAFKDYELQLNKHELKAMLKRRGFNADLSFAAFNENGKIIAFTFNGVGTFNGKRTAYDTGTRTLKEYRGKGFATRIFEYSLPFLQERGIHQYLLEVLQHNEKAISVYRNLGFEISREFNYYIQKNTGIKNNVICADIPCDIQAIEIDTYPFLSDFWDFYPSWQNSFECIKNSSESFINLGAFIENKLVGYCIFEPTSGDITQIAVSKHYRRKGVASLLLQEIRKINRNENIKVINADIHYTSISDFLEAKNIKLKGKQFEMVKKL